MHASDSRCRCIPLRHVYWMNSIRGSRAVRRRTRRLPSEEPLAVHGRSVQWPTTPQSIVVPTSRSELRRILRFLAPYKGRIAAALVALVVAASAVLVLG